MTTTVEQSIQTLSEHPQIVRAEEKRRELRDKVTAARGDIERLITKRDAIVLERDNAAAAAFVSGKEPDLTAFDATLAAVEVEGSRHSERLKHLEQAVTQHEALEKDVAGAVRAELKQQIEARVRKILKEMALQFDDLERLSAELERLRAYKLASVPHVHLALLRADVLAQWRREAKAFQHEDQR